MTIKRNDFELGTNGVAIDTINSAGPGNDGVWVALDAGAAATYDTTRAAHGTKSAKMSAPTGLTVSMGYNSVTKSLAVRFYVYLTALPSDSITLARHTASAGATRTGLVQITGAGKLSITGTGGSVWASTTSFPINQWVRVEYSYAVGATASAGVVKAGFYLGDSTTPIDALGNITNADLGTIAFDGLAFGKAAGSAYATPFWFDDIGFNDSSSTFLGPVGANIPPNIVMGADAVVSVGSPAPLTATATDSDGAIASVLWTFDTVPAGTGTPAITGATTSSASFTPTAAGLYTVRFTATDNGAATNSGTLKVYVPQTTVRPLSVTANAGSWTTTGAADAAVALADENAGTFTSSPNSPASEKTITMRLNPLPPMTALTLTLDHKLSTAGTGTAKVRLKEGVTTRREWTVAPSTTMATASLTMNSAECAAVTSWVALDVELSWGA